MMRPYIAGDAAKMDIREEDFMMPSAALDAVLQSPNTFGYTFVKEGRVGAVVGGVAMWEGVFQVFAMVNDRMKGHAVSFTEASVGLMASYAKEFSIHRMQCIVDPKIERNVKWVHYLGFHRESVMKGAALGGGDMEMYVKLFEVGHMTPLEVSHG